jgi:hypothetical protein
LTEDGNRLGDYEDVQIGEDEVKSAARSCFAIVVILLAIAVLLGIFAIAVLVY